VNLSGANTEEIIAQIDICPSGALSYKRNSTANDGNTTDKTKDSTNSAVVATVAPNGPVIITGAFALTLPDGSTVQREGKTALCRCGASANKPFCDGAHNAAGFRG
jgi:deoxycytidine triphosphate deaminase